VFSHRFIFESGPKNRTVADCGERGPVACALDCGVEPPQSKRSAAALLPTIRDGQEKTKAVQKHRTPKGQDAV
jgi:hypothetical protein